MSGDDEAGIAWWNALTERERAKWSAAAGNTGRAIDAWEAFKRASMTSVGVAGAPRELTPQEVLADLLGSGDFPAEVLDPEVRPRSSCDDWTMPASRSCPPRACGRS
jgi:hypothetical protein